MNKDGKMKVSAIQNGTVIDHIPAKSLFKVISILGLDFIDQNITIGNNLDSERYGKKGIVKVSNKFFEDKEINMIALVAPHAKLNIIKDYKVVDKKTVQTPESVFGLVKCVNPKCITNHEEMQTRFDVVVNDSDLALQCDYCEKITDQNNFTVI